MSRPIRVRFAPSPTGDLHLGNIRAALLNYLFARQKGGSFILRIEDTDAKRNIDESGYSIQNDLAWLGLTVDEGPGTNSKYAPYLQSERFETYKKHLLDLIEMGKVYRCFCSVEKLDQKRKKQLSLGLPPRYDRECLHLSGTQLEQKVEAHEPFFWRFKIDHNQTIVINDMAHGPVTFEMKNFTDFALTRADWSFTFTFTNFVDDWLMDISHVIRGEDHLSNSAMQAALFDALAVKLPTFWHLPMLSNTEGKKMSKRDFGFSLKDLKKAGFLAEAIVNYLAIIGTTTQDEVQSLDDLTLSYRFDHLHATGAIGYDEAKLTWLNHQWVTRFEPAELAERVKPRLTEQFEAAASLDDVTLEKLLQGVKTDLKTLNDAPALLRFYFEKPAFDMQQVQERVGADTAQQVGALIDSVLSQDLEAMALLAAIKAEAKNKELKLRDVFGTVRYSITGSFQGIGMNDLFAMLGLEVIQERLRQLL